ncbi:F protein [Bat paramyxovirus]|nr:F protein [Bat paramyxovirus]
MKKFLLTTLLLLVLIDSIRMQLSIVELSKIGVIKGKNYGLKIKGTMTNQFLVVKFIPNISNMTNCGQKAVDDYKQMLNRILLPINSSLTLMKSVIESRTTGVKFWGAVIGGVALGIATSAQITAGIALHNSIQNAAAINGMKESILEMHESIKSLQLSGQRTVVAISALQDQINSQIVPAINSLGCQVAENTLKLSLNQYFSELALIFGPNLRDPASETISIQTLSQAFHNDFESLLRQLSYTASDLLDVLQSDSIRGRIIDVDMNNYLMTIQIEYPSMIPITSAIIQEFNIISHNYHGTEWMAVVPHHVLIRGSLLSNIDLTKCSRTDHNYICQSDTSSPMSSSLYNCLIGKLENCARVQVVNSHVSRFALSDGVVFANCIQVSCFCKTTEQHILQDRDASNVMIAEDTCREVQVDGFYITVGKRSLNRTTISGNITAGPTVSTNPVDVSTQLGQVEEALEDSKMYLEKSRYLLDRVNPNIVNTNTTVYLIVITTIFILWMVISIIWLIFLTKKQKVEANIRYNINRGSTVNSLSSLIPTT